MMRVDATAATGDSSNAHGKHVPISTFEIESSDLPAVGIRRNNQQEEDSDEDDDGSVIIDPHAAELGGDLTSAVLGIIKGMVGPAILYLPHGFVAAGFMVALPIMAISTALYLHSSRCLLESWKYESEKQGQLVPQHHPQEEKHPSEEEEIQFQDEPEMATKLKDHQQQNHHRRHTKSLSYPELAYRAFGQKGETMVKVGIALMQSGVCLTYFIFVPHNLHTSLKLLFGWNLSPNVYLFFMTLLQIPLSWVRDIRRFTCTNALANGLILYGLLLCLWFAFSEAIQPLYNAEDAISTSNSTMSTRLLSEGGNYDNHHEFDKSGPIFNVWKHLTHLDPFGEHWILFIGTSVLLFEGSITLLIPLQEAVHPTHSEDQELDDRARFPTIYRKTILGIQVFYVIFGVTCWMSFGDDVNTVLTVSLPPGFLATTVQLGTY